MTQSSSDPAPASVPRTLFGGFLMGFANLVPGISGGTMILAVGLYERFIGAVADVTRLRLRPSTVTFLALILVGAVLAVLGLSGLLVDAVVDHRWMMYSLFVGMTLGGVPELWRATRPFSPACALLALTGLAVMAIVAFALQDTRLPETLPVFLAMGALAASSMILPGISGSYLLLIFGLYEVVIGSLRPSALKEDFGASIRVVGPVLVGAALGIAVLSNVLKVLLARYPRQSHAALLGLLVGSVLGLWPFQQPVDPELAQRKTRKAVVMALADEPRDAIREKYGEAFDDARLAALESQYAGLSAGELKKRGDALQRFAPNGKQIAGSLGLFLLGFLATRLVSRGGNRAEADPA